MTLQYISIGMSVGAIFAAEVGLYYLRKARKLMDRGL